MIVLLSLVSFHDDFTHYPVMFCIKNYNDVPRYFEEFERKLSVKFDLKITNLGAIMRWNLWLEIFRSSVEKKVLLLKQANHTCMNIIVRLKGGTDHSFIIQDFYSLMPKHLMQFMQLLIY